MRKLVLVLALSLSLMAASVLPAGAIVYGQPDGDTHPHVGGLVTDFGGGDYLLLCSGTMLDPTVFLTAAHCTSILEDMGLPAYVTFDSEFDPDDPGTLVSGTMHTHPDYVDAEWPYTPDIAVVVLDEPFDGPTAQLPEEGAVDDLMARPAFRRTEMTIVGYGQSGYTRGGGRPGPLFEDIRRNATVWLRAGHPPWNLEDSYVFHTSNPGRGGGGTCSGDSGGPLFLGEVGSDLLLGVTAGGRAVGPDGIFCVTPHNFAYRLDTPEARDFLSDFVAVPSL